MQFRAAITAAALISIAGSTHTSAAIAQSEKSVDSDLLNVTCGDFLEGLRVAQPGKNASAAQKELARAAQDDIAAGLLWVHGYLTGRDGGQSAAPLNKKWMADTVVKLAAVCRQSGVTIRIAEAAGKL